MSLHYVTDDAAVPLDFSLYLSEEWLEQQRRQKAGIPNDVTFQPKWALALALIDRSLAWEVPSGVIVADAGYGNTTEFRTGLAERKLLFVGGVQSTATVWVDSGNRQAPAAGRRGRARRKPLDVGIPMSVLEVSRNWPVEHWQRVTWREGTKGPMTSRFGAARVLPRYSYQHGGPKEETLWLLAEWPEDDTVPTKFWLANLAGDISPLILVRLAKIRWWIEQGYQQLKDELGLVSNCTNRRNAPQLSDARHHITPSKTIKY